MTVFINHIYIKLIKIFNNELYFRFKFLIQQKKVKNKMFIKIYKQKKVKQNIFKKLMILHLNILFYKQ